MRKWKALVLFSFLTALTITYAVWAYWPRMIDEETLVFNSNVNDHDRVAAKAYFDRHPPKVSWETFTYRMLNPHDRKKFTISVANFTWSDGQTFLELFYPTEQVTLKVEKNGEWKKVNVLDYTAPDAMPLVGRLFQDRLKSAEEKKIQLPSLKHDAVE